ncbi:MAG: glycosyltransferase [Nevskiaceae bacterium]|jgi:glycosyltransferase involved in cell wall biosynthesis|nr:glycosyltransferase [Nevskiaceae bacterium]
MNVRRLRLLMVFSEKPWPPRANGISVRYAPIIQALGARHTIDVAILARPGSDRFPEGLDQVCHAVHFFQRPRRVPALPIRVANRLLKCVSGKVPFPLDCYDRNDIQGFLQQLNSATPYDLIVWVATSHLDIGLAVFGGNRIAHDAIDSVYHTFIRANSGSLFNAIDARKIKAWEKFLIAQTRCTTFVSQADAALYNGDPALSNKVHVVPNGIYLGDYAAQPTPARSDGTITLGFLGHMGYPPNIAAVQRLHKILQKVRAVDSHYRLLVIGRSPAPQIQALADEATVVTGDVDSIWEYIAKADAFVFPMVSGAGQQNKVLEAMYGGKLVISNALANSGIGVTNGEQILLCESDEDFVTAILALRTDHERMDRIAAAGKAFVSERFSWDKTIETLEALWLTGLPAQGVAGSSGVN